MNHLRFLEYVDAVARAGSIRAAAERLQVAGSAVNRRILDIERELGTPLFERLPRGVRLTAAGEIFIGYARRRAADLEHVRSEIEALSGARRGHVAIAGSQAASPALLPHALVSFQAQYPGVTFDVKVVDRERAVQTLLDFEADVALVFNPPPMRGVRMLAQLPQRICAIVAPDHPLAGRASVRLKDCLAYPIAMPDHSLSGRGLLEDLLEKSSIRAMPALSSNSFEMMRGFAREAGGVSFQVEVGGGPGSGAVAVPIEERGLASGRLSLLVLRDRVLPVACALFAEFMAEKLNEMARNRA